MAFPIVWLSAPATTTRAGGKLAQLRKNYRLAQVNLGEIDPASETIKLATLGLRGVAVNLLWEKANYYKKVEDWTNLTATLEQLAKLQPNFITFWKFQAWNLTYNVSVEFDDYHDRYYYVRRGIQFLKEGEHYNHFNPNDPQLLWDLGWFIGQKIGRADEYVEYRKLFKADDDFHPPDRTMDERDNWLVGKEWYLKAIRAVESGDYTLGRKSPRDFYSSPAKSQMNYSEAIEEEGFFDKARRAWQKAGEEWRQFGKTVIEHSTGVKLYLGSQKELEKKVKDLREKLDAMMPDAQEGRRRQAESAQARGIKAVGFTAQTAYGGSVPATRGARAESCRYRSRRGGADCAASNRRRRIRPRSWPAISSSKPGRCNTRLTTSTMPTLTIGKIAPISSRLPDALDARRDMFLAKKAFHDADVTNAKRLYEEGFKKWRPVIDKFPAILDDEQTTRRRHPRFHQSVSQSVGSVRRAIGEDFPLWDVIEKFDRESEFTEELTAHHKHQPQPAAGARPSATPPTPAKPATPPTPAVKPAQQRRRRPHRPPATNRRLPRRSSAPLVSALFFR